MANQQSSGNLTDVELPFNVFNVLPQAALIVDSDGTAQATNQALLALIGKTEQEVLESGWLNIIEVDSRGKLQADLAKRLAEGAAFEVAISLISKRRSPQSVLLQALPLNDEPKRWLFLFNQAAAKKTSQPVADDRVTPGKEENLAEMAEQQHLQDMQMQATHEEQVFRLMVANVKDYAIFMLDPNGHVMTWNAGAQRIKGYRAEEIIGKHFSEFYTEDAKAIQHPQHELQIARETGRYEEEGWRVRKDGSMFWANVVITAIRDGAGSLIGFAKITRDLTERKMAENELRRTNEELARANTAKDIFLANMSHELRTPLNSIIGFNDVMMMGLVDPLTPDQMKQADYIRRAAEHLLSLINDILDLAKIESGNMELLIEPQNINKIVSEVVEGLQPLADERSLYLRINSNHSDFFVMGDDRGLRQIATNLISNAIKFTDEGGVAISIEPAGSGKVAVSVSDTGIGISHDDQTKLFKGFVQLARSQRKQEGTGLGLALSKRLANLMDGDITLSSDTDHGSIFTVHLPMASGE